MREEEMVEISEFTLSYAFTALLQRQRGKLFGLVNALLITIVYNTVFSYYREKTKGEKQEGTDCKFKAKT